MDHLMGHGGSSVVSALYCRDTSIHSVTWWEGMRGLQQPLWWCQPSGTSASRSPVSMHAQGTDSRAAAQQTSLQRHISIWVEAWPRTQAANLRAWAEAPLQSCHSSGSIKQEPGESELENNPVKEAEHSKAGSSHRQAKRITDHTKA